MASQLSTLIYASRSAIKDSGGVVTTELNNILAAARRNNPAAGLTGALIFTQDYFAQVLEGPAASVEAVFSTIELDPRHCDVVTLKKGPITRRAFPDWSMAFVQASDPEALDKSLAESGLRGPGGPGQAADALVTTLYDLIALHEAQAGEALAWPTFGDA